MKKKRVKRKNEKYYKSFPFKRGEFMSNTGINILILGKTGVGKSSFCNYIFDQELFRTGTGKPVFWSNGSGHSNRG